MRLIRWVIWSAVLYTDCQNCTDGKTVKESFFVTILTRLFIHLLGLLSKRCKHDLDYMPMATEWKWDWLSLIVVYNRLHIFPKLLSYFSWYAWSDSNSILSTLVHIQISEFVRLFNVIRALQAVEWVLQVKIIHCLRVWYSICYIHTFFYVRPRRLLRMPLR